MLLRLALGLVLLSASPFYPQDPQVSVDKLMQEARDAQNRRDFRGAVRKYREAAKLQPDAAIYEKLGLACFLANSYPQAIDAFSNALRSEPRRWVSQLFMGESLYKLNRFQEALPHVTNALELNPQQNETRYWLGCIYHALGSFDQAIAQLLAASNHDPNNADILYTLTETYLDYSTNLSYGSDRGVPSQERKAVIEQKIHAVASNALVDEDAWKSAVSGLQTGADRYRTALKSDPEAAFALSMTYGQLGQLMAERVWKLNPGSYQSHELLAQSYENQGNYEAALPEYRQALRIDPSAPGLNFGVGHAYWELKQFSEAIPELEKELVLNPSHPSANYVLGHIYLHSDPQQLEKAELYLQRAIAAKPDYAAAREQLGRTLSLMHEYQKAVQQLELAAMEDPRDESVHYLLAGTYRKMGLEEKARKELDTFNQLRAEKHIDDKAPN